MCDFLDNQYSDNDYQETISNQFFQFTLNTQKLTQIFNKTSQAIHHQEQKSNKTTNNLIKMIQNLEAKFNLESEKTNMLFTKMNKQITENSNIVKLYVGDLDTSIKKNEARIQSMLKELPKMKSEVNKVGDCLKEEFVAGLSELKENLIGSYKARKYEDEEKVKEEGESGKKDDLEDELKIENFSTMYEHFSEKIKEIETTLPLTMEKMLYAYQQQMKKNEKQSYIKQGLRRDQFYRKIENKQNKQSHNKSVNKFAYTSSRYKEHKEEIRQCKQEETNTKTTSHQKKDPHKVQRHMSLKFHDNEFDLIQHIKNVEEKLEESLKTEVDQIRNKWTVLEEKGSILSRKCDKIMHEVGEVKMHIRKLESVKNDEKAVEELRNYVKWVIRDLQEKLSLKCEHVELENEKRRVSEKIAIVHQNLLQKAQKGQIQKALVFLEGKIKEIILLIASEQNEQRDGAMVKTAIKCLSCDKDLEKNITQPERKKSGEIPKSGSYSRSLTHRTRQKYKQILKQNQTSGNESLEYFQG